jgi:hypothetical protein
MIHEMVILPGVFCAVFLHCFSLYENGVESKMFGSKEEEDGAKLHSWKLNGSCSSPDNARVIKLRRMWWVVHVERVRVMGNCRGGKII